MEKTPSLEQRQILIIHYCGDNGFVILCYWTVTLTVSVPQRQHSFCTSVLYKTFFKTFSLSKPQLKNPTLKVTTLVVEGALWSNSSVRTWQLPAPSPCTLTISQVNPIMLKNQIVTSLQWAICLPQVLWRQVAHVTWVSKLLRLPLPWL